MPALPARSPVHHVPGGSHDQDDPVAGPSARHPADSAWRASRGGRDPTRKLRHQRSLRSSRSCQDSTAQRCIRPPVGLLRPGDPRGAGFNLSCRTGGETGLSTATAASPAEIVDHSLSSRERAVLEACAEDFPASQIHVRPLGRFGYSGARLFEARFDKEGHGSPWVVKLDREDVIAREDDAMKTARAYYHEATASRHLPREPNGFAGLLYKLIRAEDGRVTELRDLYVTGRNADRVCDVLDSLYAYCRVGHGLAPKPDTVQLAEEYKWYMHDKRPDRILEVWPAGMSRVELLGKVHRHPHATLEIVENLAFQAPRGFVHGDLHPNNVVLSGGGRPNLIDFAWAHNGDILTDFVLMENSLRFALFPSHVDWAQHSWVNQVLTSEDGPLAIQEKYTVDESLPLRDHYLQMARAVEVIRRHARACSGDSFDYRHYLASQFIVLYGCTKLDVYPFLLSVDALLGIGAKILGG